MALLRFLQHSYSTPNCISKTNYPRIARTKKNREKKIAPRATMPNTTCVVLSTAMLVRRRAGRNSDMPAAAIDNPAAKAVPEVWYVREFNGDTDHSIAASSKIMPPMHKRIHPLPLRGSLSLNRYRFVLLVKILTRASRMRSIFRLTCSIELAARKYARRRVFRIPTPNVLPRLVYDSYSGYS